MLSTAGAGFSTDEIASELHLPPATVRNYSSNAIAKVGARNRLDAVRIARDAGWSEGRRTGSVWGRRTHPDQWALTLVDGTA